MKTNISQFESEDTVPFNFNKELTSFIHDVNNRYHKLISVMTRDEIKVLRCKIDDLHRALMNKKHFVDGDIICDGDKTSQDIQKRADMHSRSVHCAKYNVCIYLDLISKPYISVTNDGIKYQYFNFN